MQGDAKIHIKVVHFLAIMRIEVNHFLLYHFHSEPLNHRKGGEKMTDMKRATVSFPDDIVDAIEALRKTEEHERDSYSEIVRFLVTRGLEKLADEKTA